MTANIPAILTGLSIGTVASGVGIAVVSYGEGGGAKFEKIFLDGSNEIISKYRNMPCVNSLFETIKWYESPNSNDTKTKIGSSTISLANDKTEGCIYVWWQKETYDDKWRGAWNLLWGMRDDKYGTIFVSTITADRGKVQVDKYVYVLEKKNDKWESIGKWFKDKETATNDNKSTLTVTIGDTLSNPNNNLDNFVSDTEKVCSNTRTCHASSATIDVKELSWKYKQEGAPTNVKAASNWNTKINNLIKDSNSLDIDLQKVYTNISGHYELEQTVHG